MGARAGLPGPRLRSAARASLSDHGREARSLSCPWAPGALLPLLLGRGVVAHLGMGVAAPFLTVLPAPGPGDLILMGGPLPPHRGSCDCTDASAAAATRPRVLTKGAVCAGATLGCEQAQ